ncbi:MAG: ComF family protein [Candidatus Binatus sp.]
MPALAQTFSQNISTVLDFLYPPRCTACGTSLESGAGQQKRVCAECVARVERMPDPRCEVCGGPLESAVSDASRCARCLAHPPRYRIARTIARYRTTAEDEPGSLPALIRRHKYGLDQSVGRALAEYLGDELPLSASDYDVVIPVPLHWRRLWWRGFNQAALLAAEVARRLDLPLDTTAMARRRFTTPQTSRHHDERIKNVRRAFAVTHSERVQNRRVLIVDDVMTTGATVDECARVLLAAGATSVDVFTLARVL